jgi:hypothetical protein
MHWSQHFLDPNNQAKARNKMGNKRTTIVAMSLLLTVVLVFSGCAGGGSKLVKHELTIGVQGKGSVTP